MRFELKGRGVMTFMGSYYLAACDGGDRRLTHVLGGELENVIILANMCRGQSKHEDIISVGPNSKFGPNTEYVRVLKMNRIRIPNSAIRSKLFE